MARKAGFQAMASGGQFDVRSTCPGTGITISVPLRATLASGASRNRFARTSGSLSHVCNAPMVGLVVRMAMGFLVIGTLMLTPPALRDRRSACPPQATASPKAPLCSSWPSRTSTGNSIPWPRRAHRGCVCSLTGAGSSLSKGQYDCRYVDKQVNAARAHNLNVLGVIAYTPEWARPVDTYFTPPAGRRRRLRSVRRRGSWSIRRPSLRLGTVE